MNAAYFGRHALLDIAAPASFKRFRATAIACSSVIDESQNILGNRGRCPRAAHAMFDDDRGTITGLSTGAKQTNRPWSRYFHAPD
jgi:hypothetical protein